jgi:hypothetical protein
MVKAQTPAKTDPVPNILQLNNKDSLARHFVKYLNDYYEHWPASQLESRKVELKRLLAKYNVESRKSFNYYIESIYQYRLSHFNESERNMVLAINASANDDFLSYTFLNYLAFKQTENGNVIDAISSYRVAKQKAIKLNDTKLQMIADINISDVFYKNNFYNQSLFYLNQAQAISEQWSENVHVKNIIYYNKSENFFRMEEYDSLKLYHERLIKAKNDHNKLYTYQQRTAYYLLLLQHNYHDAINLINKLQKDKLYRAADQDLQNLADAYFKNKQPDSAHYIVDALLIKPSLENHPEIKFHLYELLGEIAEEKGNDKIAAENFKLGLQQVKENNSRLTQVDNITSLIKVDELEGFYSQKDKSYKSERLWLILAVALALIVVLVLAMFYRAIKQKRHFEKLLYAAKKEELAFINSHDVRRHLTNILGLIEVIRQGDGGEKDYLQSEAHLFESANELDKAIKNISDKLTE